MAKLLGCKLETAGRTRVAVADGTKIRVCAKIANFKWNFQDYQFQSDVMVISLGGHDMVLGVHWLSKLGPITWDFDKLFMQFKWQQKKCVLHGLKQGSVREVKAKRFEQVKDPEIQLHMIYAYEEEKEDILLSAVEQVAVTDTEISAIDRLTAEFSEIFEEPVELPPFRDKHNHKITLMEGANPVNHRPYRYALHQKDEVDKMVKELLAAGTVQPSCSPYASPVVLVKKKDNTWRLCVEYRKLNQMTVKDRFPIPLN